MASPRTLLKGVPTEGSDALAGIGAAENFPRRDPIVVIPTGTRAIFSPSQDVEGVWHEGAHGTIGTATTVQWFPAGSTAEKDVCARGDLPDRESVQTGKGGLEGVPCPWIIIPMDGARHTRSGPRPGYAKTDSPVEPSLSRTGCVRGIASTSVRSPYLGSTESEDGADKEEAATESSDALPVDDKEVVPAEAWALYSGAEFQRASNAGPQAVHAATMLVRPTRESVGTKIPRTKTPGLSPCPRVRQREALRSRARAPGSFIGARNYSKRSCSNKLIGN